jgi:hypothetical protein
MAATAALVLIINLFTPVLAVIGLPGSLQPVTGNETCLVELDARLAVGPRNMSRMKLTRQPGTGVAGQGCAPAATALGASAEPGSSAGDPPGGIREGRRALGHTPST